MVVPILGYALILLALIYQSFAQTLTVTLELIVSELYSGNKYGRCEIDHFLYNCLQGVG